MFYIGTLFSFAKKLRSMYLNFLPMRHNMVLDLLWRELATIIINRSQCWCIQLFLVSTRAWLKQGKLIYGLASHRRQCLDTWAPKTRLHCSTFLISLFTQIFDDVCKYLWWRRRRFRRCFGSAWRANLSSRARAFYLAALKTFCMLCKSRFVQFIR